MPDRERPVGLHEVEEVPLSELLLDPKNPRFAGALGAGATQEEIVDFIAGSIGLRDLLSSMSQSGYHRSSPLVGVCENSNIIVVEGNRRLASALILMSDPRARSQQSRASNYTLDPGAADSLARLPVLIASSRKEVLPYLGVAHIVGTKKWDSYAKAAWAADVLHEGAYPGGLKEIADLIGDQHRTLERMVEAYNLVQYLKETGRFSPEEAMRSGRGSADFPFSWVYTALGFASIRTWLGVPSGKPEDEQAELIRTLDYPDQAAELLKWMFGNKADGSEPLLDDSRQISDLAAAVSDSRQVSLLRAGKALSEAREAIRPARDKIMDGLVRAREELTGVLGVLGSSGEDIPPNSLPQLEDEGRQVYRAANMTYKQLRELGTPPDDIED